MIDERLSTGELRWIRPAMAGRTPSSRSTAWQPQPVTEQAAPQPSEQSTAYQPQRRRLETAGDSSRRRLSIEVSPRPSGSAEPPSSLPIASTPHPRPAEAGIKTARAVIFRDGWRIDQDFEGYFFGFAQLMPSKTSLFNFI